MGWTMAARCGCAIRSCGLRLARSVRRGNLKPRRHICRFRVVRDESCPRSSRTLRRGPFGRRLGRGGGRPYRKPHRSIRSARLCRCFQVWPLALACRVHRAHDPGWHGLARFCVFDLVVLWRGSIGTRWCEGAPVRMDDMGGGRAGGLLWDCGSASYPRSLVGNAGAHSDDSLSGGHAIPRRTDAACAPTSKAAFGSVFRLTPRLPSVINRAFPPPARRAAWNHMTD